MPSVSLMNLFLSDMLEKLYINKAENYRSFKYYK